jgi:hypothetical protein
MTSRGRHLFTEALAPPERDRLAFLEWACAGDTIDNAKVLALLKAHAGPESLLSSAPAMTAATMAAGDR